MDRSGQLWNQLLQQFQCENNDQLVTLGIPIQKNELYIAACSEADPDMKKEYEAIATLTLLHTHFHFVEYALNNDAFFMSCWAKHYRENCISNDEFAVIHEEILNVGGLDRLPQNNVLLSAKLLSVYCKLGLPLELEPISQVKETYMSSTNIILECILNNKTPSVADRRTPIALTPSADGIVSNAGGFGLSLYRSNEYYAYRKKYEIAKINDYLGKSISPNASVSAPSSQNPLSLPEIFSTIPVQYDLSVLDGFGETVAKRYTYLAEKLYPIVGSFNERLFSLLENAYAADPLNAKYKDARYRYLQAGFENDLKSIPAKFDSQLEQMTKACTTISMYDMQKPYSSIVSETQGALVRISERKRKFLNLSKVSDPKIEELWNIYYSDTEKEYAQIKARADDIKRNVEDTIHKWNKKCKFKKIIIPISIASALIVIALVVVGVLL